MTAAPMTAALQRVQAVRARAARVAAFNGNRCPECPSTLFRVDLAQAPGINVECLGCGAKHTITHGPGDALHVERAAS